MSSREDYKASVPLDIETGLVIYRGVEYTYKELMDLWESEEYDYQDELDALRDRSLDNQNLWGSKKDHFQDTWWKRKKPDKRTKGYPRDLI